MENRMLHVCRDGHEDEVRTLLSQGVGVDVVDEDERTPLMLASMRGQGHIVALLLSEGAEVNKKAKCGKTALIFSCMNGHDSVTKMLADGGASVNSKDVHGQTALIWVCKNGKDNVDLLIEQGASVNERSANGNTALREACVNGRTEVVKRLIAHDADVRIKTSDGETVLMIVCENGDVDMLKLLINRLEVDLNERDEDGRTALIKACEQGRDEIVEILLKHDGVDVNVSDDNGFTPLMCACGFGRNQTNRERIVPLLKSHGADLDKQDFKYGRTASMLAIMKDDVRCLQVLLRSSPTPSFDMVDINGHTVFTYAIKRENTNCLETLLDSRMILEKDGKLKALHRSTIDYIDHLEILKLTIRYGVFEWAWCPIVHFNLVARAALKSCYCPGKIRQSPGKDISLLTLSFLTGDTDLSEMFLKNLYFFPDDYKALCQNKDIRKGVKDKHLLEELTRQPMRLQSWSFLTVSKCISLAGHPGLRRERVDCLEIPEPMKKMLRFEY